jgi:hypothetical protein
MKQEMRTHFFVFNFLAYTIIRSNLLTKAELNSAGGGLQISKAIDLKNYIASQ